VIDAGSRENNAGSNFVEIYQAKSGGRLPCSSLKFSREFSANPQVNTRMWHFHRTFKSDKIVEH
jgi:hypothetical protein